MSLDKFRTLSVSDKLNVIYNELLIIKERQKSEPDDRPMEIQLEFPLRRIPLDLCVCGHTDDQHQIELQSEFYGDGACGKCVCNKFAPAYLEKGKK